MNEKQNAKPAAPAGFHLVAPDTARDWTRNAKRADSAHQMLESLSGIPGCTELHYEIRRSDNSPFLLKAFGAQGNIVAQAEDFEDGSVFSFIEHWDEKHLEKLDDAGRHHVITTAQLKDTATWVTPLLYTPN